MKNIIYVILSICFMFIFVGFLIYGVDREMARQEFLNNNRNNTNCIFPSNCDHFNKL